MLQHLITWVSEKQTTPIEIITTHEETKAPTSLCVFANARSRRTKGAGAVINFVNTNIMLIARTVNRQVYKTKNVIHVVICIKYHNPYLHVGIIHSQLSGYVCVIARSTCSYWQLKQMLKATSKGYGHWTILKALCHDIRRNCFLMSSLVQKSN